MVKVLFFGLRSNTVFITVSVAVAIFTDTFLYGLQVTMFPFTLEKFAKIPEADVQTWSSLLLGLYGAGIVVGSPFFGWLADIYQNRRTPLLAGLAVFIAATIMLWLGRHIAIFCVARVLQGFASSIVWSVGLALLVDTVGSENVAIQVSYVNIALSCGYLSGPVIGGVIYQALGYNAVFIISLALLFVDVVFRLLLIEKAEARRLEAQACGSERDDPTTRLLPSDSHGNKTTTTAAFVTLLRSLRLVASLLCTFVQAILLTSLEATLPLHLHELFGYGSAKAALSFMALMVPSLFSPIIGNLCNHFGDRHVLTGAFLSTGVTIILLRLPTGYDAANQAGLILLLVCVGFAINSVLTPIMTEIFHTVERIEEKKPGCLGVNGAFAQSYALFNLAYATGTLVGPIIAGEIKSHYSWATMTLCLGILAICSTLLSELFLGDSEADRNRAEVSEV